MNRFHKTTGNLFGFKRREKRATLILALILLLIIILRFSVLSRDSKDVVVADLPESDTVFVPEANAKEQSTALFHFDPNTATRAMLLSLGISPRQASTLINYRNAGGRFISASDLFKVYGFDTSQVMRLMPYVVIEKQNISVAGSRSNMSVSDADSETVIYSGRCIIDLNACSARQLEVLPGIGTALSERIIKYRNLLGGFVNTDQLKEVYGIDSSTMNNIRELVYANPDYVKLISFDTCSFSYLARHPYVGKEAARSIIKYREFFGPPASIDVLVKQKVIDSVKARRMALYFTIAENPENKGL